MTAFARSLWKHHLRGKNGDGFETGMPTSCAGALMRASMAATPETRSFGELAGSRNIVCAEKPAFAKVVCMSFATNRKSLWPVGDGASLEIQGLTKVNAGDRAATRHIRKPIPVRVRVSSGWRHPPPPAALANPSLEP